MKNKNLVLVLIFVIILLVFGAGAYFLSKSKTPSSSTMQKAEVTPAAQSSNSAANTLKDLIASKTPVKCTYSNDVANAKISGTVYVANGKVRGDFTTTSGSNVIVGHMATDDKFVYTWSEGSKQGYKFSMDTINSAKAKEGQTAQTPDLNQKFNYSCAPWALDNSMLVLPSNVTFTTFSMPVAPTTGAAGTTGVSNQTMCAACAGLTGDAKTQCLTQLHCN